MNEHFMGTVKTLPNRLLNPWDWCWICSFLLTSLNCYAAWLFIFEVQWSEVTQLCPTLCDPMDCSPPGSSVPGIFQARVLEWVAISFSRRSSWSRDWSQISRVIGRRLLSETPGKSYSYVSCTYLSTHNINFERVYKWTQIQRKSCFHSVPYVHIQCDCYL